MRVLLSCIGRRSYLADWFREALGPDDTIIGTSNTPLTAGFSACDRSVVLPDIRSDEYSERVVEVVQEEGVDVLLSLLDPDVVALSAIRPQLEAAGVQAFLPGSDTARICLDKVASADFLQNMGLDGPATYATGAAEALASGALQYPVIVKERFGYASDGLTAVNDDAELAVALERMSEPVVQEWLAGDEHNLSILTDLEGEVRAVVVARKLAVRAGETDQAQTVDHPVAVEKGRVLGQALAAYGPLDVDVFIEGDSVRVLEMNPRFGGGYPVAHLAGADFPRRIIAMARGEADDRAVDDYERGVVMLKDYAIRRGPA